MSSERQQIIEQYSTFLDISKKYFDNIMEDVPSMKSPTKDYITIYTFKPENNNYTSTPTQESSYNNIYDYCKDNFSVNTFDKYVNDNKMIAKLIMSSTGEQLLKSIELMDKCMISLYFNYYMKDSKCVYQFIYDMVMLPMSIDSKEVYIDTIIEKFNTNIRKYVISYMNDAGYSMYTSIVSAYFDNPDRECIGYYYDIFRKLATSESIPQYLVELGEMINGTTPTISTDTIDKTKTVHYKSNMTPETLDVENVEDKEETEETEENKDTTFTSLFDALPKDIQKMIDNKYNSKDINDMIRMFTEKQIDDSEQDTPSPTQKPLSNSERILNEFKKQEEEGNKILPQIYSQETIFTGELQGHDFGTLNENDIDANSDEYTTGISIPKDKQSTTYIAGNMCTDIPTSSPTQTPLSDISVKTISDDSNLTSLFEIINKDIDAETKDNDISN